MRTLDKFETLVRDAQVAVCIMGNLQTSDFELVDVTKLPLSEDRRRSMIDERGMVCLGVTGFVNGVPSTALNEWVDASVISFLAKAFLSHLGARLQVEAEQTNNEAVRWLADLFALNDQRPT